MSSSSKTSDSHNQTSSFPSASTSNNCNGVLQYYLNNFLTEIANSKETELRPQVAGERQHGDGLWDDQRSPENPTSSVLVDSEQFLSAENRAYLSNVNPTPSFNLCDLPFIDNNGQKVHGVQTFSYPNPGMFFGNQYAHNSDIGSESTSAGYVSNLFDQANNSSAGLSSTPSISQTSTDCTVGMFTGNFLAPPNTKEYRSTLKEKQTVRTNVSLNSATSTSDSSTLGSKTDSKWQLLAQCVVLINYGLGNVNPNADFSQRSSALQKSISTAGYSAETAIPSVHWHMQMPSTSKAPYVDSTLGQRGIPMETHSTDPTTQLPQNFPSSTGTSYAIAHDENVPATSKTSSATTKRRYLKKPLPSETLYTMQKGKYICQYKGPACPEGCSVKTADVRNLCRHLRNHARKEKKMNVPQEERVACNGIPGESLYLEVSCPFKKDADRGKCRFYRETGTIWKVMTLERWETVMDSHKAEYHSPGDGS
ncbi:hypothetical protein Clacol_004983 [Clathrus columnatus]|uniref:C2H2-type domain-containing protein n=1 Tax=Clathrus columnatus TaxID=1419009 RepID=A0AAV5A8W6_9AGAM|nr:hypothetical protein Clacol_004983 [Clathrus columnatus]